MLYLFEELDIVCKCVCHCVCMYDRGVPLATVLQPAKRGAGQLNAALSNWKAMSYQCLKLVSMHGLVEQTLLQ